VTARYAVIHNRSVHSTTSWLIVNLPVDARSHGDVVATCPSEATAITTCNALNQNNNNPPQGGDTQ
jgi:hypothetical protein